MFATFPIGGYNAGIPGLANYIPLALVSDTIINANPGTLDCLVSINGAINNLAISPINVVVLAFGSTLVNLGAG